MAAAAATLGRLGAVLGQGGSLAARLGDGAVLITPEAAPLAAAGPDAIARIGVACGHERGDLPSSDLDLHRAGLCGPWTASALVATPHALALSLIGPLDPQDALPPLTPAGARAHGAVRALPYHRPGAPGLQAGIAALAPTVRALLLPRLGLFARGPDIASVLATVLEVEATARLTRLTDGHGAKPLSGAERALFEPAPPR